MIKIDYIFFFVLVVPVSSDHDLYISVSVIETHDFGWSMRVNSQTTALTIHSIYIFNQRFLSGEK